MSYKSMLLKPFETVIKTKILGQQVFIRRLSSLEMLDYQDQTEAVRGSLSNKDLAVKGINLLLNALVNEDGTRPAKKDLPTAEELLVIHSNPDLLDAITTVQRHSYGTLEEAEKN
ncbi:phage tail protein [Yersinia kristensenii]|nr:phage tail protein [Yersinia kristensenii]